MWSDADHDLAERDLLAVRERLERVLGLGGRMNGDGRLVLERQAPVTGDVIGMRVRLEDARDPNVPLLGLLEVLLDRVCRIDDHGLTRGLVADQVGRAAEIVIDELPELHEQGAYNLGRTTDTPLQPEVSCDHHALDFVGALADFEDLLVAVEPRDRRLVHEAVATVDLESLVDDPV